MDKKFLISSLLGGLLAFFLFFLRDNKKEDVKPKKGKLIVGNVISEGVDDDINSYVSKYFKDREYFGIFEPPREFIRNWRNLSIQLDRIRDSFGSAILVRKGYSPSGKDEFSKCQAVVIYPRNHQYSALYDIVSALSGSGRVEIRKFELDRSNGIVIYV